MVNQMDNQSSNYALQLDLQTPEDNGQPDQHAVAQPSEAAGRQDKQPGAQLTDMQSGAQPTAHLGTQLTDMQSGAQPATAQPAAAQSAAAQPSAQPAAAQPATAQPSAQPAATQPAPQATAAFLLSAQDKLTAGAYEEMLKKKNIMVVLEHRNMNPYAAIAESGRFSGAAGGNIHSISPVNLYVPSNQLTRARELIEEYDNQTIVYNTPPPVLNQKSRTSQALFAFIIFLIFVIPIGASIYVIGSRILSYFFTR